MSDGVGPKRTGRRPPSDDQAFIGERLATNCLFSAGWRPSDARIRFANANSIIHRAAALLKQLPDEITAEPLGRDVRRHRADVNKSIARQREALLEQGDNRPLETAAFDPARSPSTTYQLSRVVEQKTEALHRLVSELMPANLSDEDHELVAGLTLELAFSCDSLSMLLPRSGLSRSGKVSVADVISDFRRREESVGKDGGKKTGGYVSSDAQAEKLLIFKYIETNCLPGLKADGISPSTPNIIAWFQANMDTWPARIHYADSMLERKILPTWRKWRACWADDAE